MKKFMKVCLITGAILFGAGIIVTIVGAFNVDGGVHRVKKVIVNGSHIFDFESHNGNIIKNEVWDDDYCEPNCDKDHEHNHERRHGNESNHRRHGGQGPYGHHRNDAIDCEEVLSLDGIKSISINIEGSETEIVGRNDISGVVIPSCCNGVTYRYDEDELEIYIIKCDDNGIVYIPENIENKELDITTNGSGVVVDSITAMELDADVAGADFNFLGSVTTKLDVSCTGGNVVMELDNDLEIYDVEVECMAGKVVVGNEDYSGIFVDQSIKRGNNKKIDVECSAGNVEIREAESL